MKGKTLIVVFAMVAVACSGADTSATSVGSTTTLGSTTTTTTPPASTTTSLDPEELEVSDEVVDYLAAVDELLADTAYEEVVDEDPEVIVATGFLFCEELTGGDAPADVLTTYVETLTDSDIEEATDDDLTLAGSILGSAVGYLCPEHTGFIEDDL